MDKRIRQVVWAWLVGALALGLAVHPVLAASKMRPGLQEEAFDPLLRAVVARGVAATAGAPASAVSTPVTEGPGSIIAGRRPFPVPRPEGTSVPDGESIPAPEAEEAAPRADVPEIDLSTQIEYSYGGITLRAPIDWDVLEDSFGSLFEITMPGMAFYAAIQEIDDEFPGLFLVTFLTNLPELFLTEFLEDGALTSMETGLTAQQIPLAAVHFDTTIEGLEGSGALYVISPGETVYLLTAFAPSDEWAALAPGVAMIAESIVFDEELLTLVTAEGGDLAYTHSRGLIETTIPEGWHVTSTNDEELSLFVADPDYTFGVVLGVDAEDGAELGSLADELLGDLDTELAQETLDWVFDELTTVMSGEGDFVVDETLNAYYPREGALTFRMAGEGDLGDGLAMPVVVYFDLRNDGSVMQFVIGDIEAALEMEPDLLAIMASTVVLE